MYCTPRRDRRRGVAVLCDGDHSPHARAEQWGKTIGVLTGLRAKHANGEHWGVDGEMGKIVDMKTYGLYESASVKVRRRFMAVDIV